MDSDEKTALLFDSPWARQGVAQFDTGKRATKPYESIARPGGGMPGANPGANNPTGLTSVPIGEKPPPVPTTDRGRDINSRCLPAGKRRRRCGLPARPRCLRTRQGSM